MPTDRPQHHRQVIRLAELTQDNSLIEGHDFDDCEVIGPAVVVPLNETSLVGCTWDAPSAEAMFWVIGPERTEIVGAIGLANCVFTNCRFRNVGVGARADQMPGLRAGFAVR